MSISCKGISVRLGATQALLNVDFDAAPGMVTGLIGPNGSGKTTLLRALAGLQAVDSGSVLCNGADASTLTPRKRAQTVSYLAQGGAVHWPVRAESLVALGRLPHRRQFGGATASDQNAIVRAMRGTDTLQFRDRTVDRLSGGEKIRVLLARALAVEAPVLLADEPIAALDPLHQLQVMALLRNKAKEQTTVVAILHDLSLAARYCEHLVLLAEGRVIAQGAPDAVLTDENMAAAFRVRVLRGECGGRSFVLPWSPLENDAGYSG